VDNYSHGDAYAQYSERNMDAGPVENSAKGPEAQELEKNEHYSLDFTNSEASIPYTWLLNGA
jgi:hypothetical protein